MWYWDSDSPGEVGTLVALEIVGVTGLAFPCGHRPAWRVLCVFLALSICPTMALAFRGLCQHHS